MPSRRTFIIAGAAIAVVSGGFATNRYLRANAPAEGQLTPPEALAAVRAGEILLIDIRRPDEWQRTGVAEGAIPIDMRRDDFVAALQAARSFEAQPVAVICARGVRSRRLTNRLTQAGITDIIDIPEGMLGSQAGPGWLQRDLPVVAWTG